MSTFKPLIGTNNRLFGCEVNGKFRTVGDWAEELGIGGSTLRYRILRGWSYEEITTTEPKPRRLPHRAP